MPTCAPSNNTTAISPGANRFILEDGSRRKKSPDPRPISLHHHLRTQMPAPREKMEPNSHALREPAHRSPRNIRIILRMEHQNFLRRQLRHMMHRVEEHSGMQLVPVLLRQPVPIPERLANIGSVARVRCFFLLFLAQDAPVHHRAVRNHLLHPLIPRRKNRSRAPEASTNHEDFIWRQFEPPPKSRLFHTLGQLIHHVAQVLLRRLLQKHAIALPGPAPSRIKDPISLSRKKLREPLFAWHPRHSVAQKNHSVPLPFPRRRQKLRHDLLLESRPEHEHARSIEFLRDRKTAHPKPQRTRRTAAENAEAGELKARNSKRKNLSNSKRLICLNSGYVRPSVRRMTC